MHLVVDGFGLHPYGKGISRVLQGLIPALAREISDSAWKLAVLTRPTGRELAEALAPDASHLTAESPNYVMWTQRVMPRALLELGRSAAYVHGDLLGRLPTGTLSILHLPELPQDRWALEKSHRVRRNAVYRPLLRASIDRASTVATSSTVVAQRVREHYRSAHKREIPIIPLAVDTGLFTPASDGTFLAPGWPYILVAYSDDKRDQINDVLRLFERRYDSSRRPEQNLTVKLIGGGLSYPSSNVVTQLGRVSDQELVRLYRGAVAFLHPGRLEGFGLQPLEALACGCPVLAAHSAIARETLGSCAVYFGNPAEAYAAAQRLATDIAWRRRVIADGLEHSSRFSWGRSAKIIMKLFSSLRACSQDL